MEWPPAFCLWVVFFALQLWVYGCFGCFYEEESALLELKSSINHPNLTSLPSWRVGTNCCTWEGVTCSYTVGRVIALDLFSTRDDYFLNEHWSTTIEWYLNASLLLPFEELQSLDLSWNELSGFIDEEALNRWSRLSKLDELDLSYNNLNETILPFLGALKSLKKLDVSANYFGGPLPIKGFCKLKGLQRLDISHNSFEGPIPLCLSNLTSLQLLNLSSNEFSGMLPISTTGNDESQGPLPINVFSVAYNNLSGRTPDMKSQFSTFSESSYEGNPLLCGQPLRRSCISTAPISEAPEDDENEDDDNIVSFYGSFVGSYLVFLIGTIGVLYFTSQRRATCFLHIVDSWCAFRLYKLYRLCSWK